MKYIVRPAARRDVARTFRSIEAEQPAAAARFIDAVESTFEAIASQPDLLGHELGFRRHAGVRSFRIPPPFERYLVFFHPHPKHVEFKRVLHGARHLPRLFRTRRPGSAPGAPPA